MSVIDTLTQRDEAFASMVHVLDATLRPIPCRDYLRSGFWPLNPAAR
jgi:hypothetical protein